MYNMCVRMHSSRLIILLVANRMRGGVFSTVHSSKQQKKNIVHSYLLFNHSIWNAFQCYLVHECNFMFSIFLFSHSLCTVFFLNISTAFFPFHLGTLTYTCSDAWACAFCSFASFFFCSFKCRFWKCCFC